MPVKQTIPYSFGTFFITFTCYQWLPLIEKVSGFDIIYNWFNHLKSKGHYINGYVIMPNHVHVIVSFIETAQNINTIIGNGKRFMAYEIIKHLELNRETTLLQKLSNSVETKRKANNKLHEVWELSFDWKECNTPAFINQKLNYIHDNPCSKKWNLCNSPVEYLHSSAKYYIGEEAGIYPVTNYMEMEDVQFTKMKGLL
jgi:REP element-mobilizing transposase RayT